MAAASGERFYQNKNLLRLYGLMIPGTLIVSATMGYDGSMMNGLQAVERWNTYFGNPTGSLLGIMNAILPLGAVFGIPLAAWVSDNYGRRWAMTVGDAIMIIGAIIQTASINMAMFLISRFVIGFGLTVAGSSAPMLTAELAHPSSRTTITSMYNTLWYVGSIIAAWVTYGTFRINNDWSWRIPALLQLIPSVINLAGCWWLPESPRWLIGKERYDEAKEVLIKWHGNGDANSELMQLEYTEIYETIQLEMSLGKQSWKQLVNSPGNRYRTFLVLCCAYFPQWSGVGLVSYYLAPVLRTIGIVDQERITLINGIIQIWNMIVSMVGANLVNRLGRRKIFISATTCMLLIMVAWTVAGSQYSVTKSEAAGSAVLFCVVAFMSAYNFAWNPLSVAYPVEILTFPIRAKGVSLLVGAVKSASFFNQFVNPIGLASLGWKFYIVYCCWLGVVLTVIIFMFPETMGRTLEEIAFIFDKEVYVNNTDAEKVLNNDGARESTEEHVADKSGAAVATEEKK
ncbi:general substrate transporter [Microdochium trichocladiopsis]|uniref:General substrate transporter n=1 Tax=Microdochium trichocladiopsis TaxID=1682393 RepID=A0A9P9BVT0_9PEZI|nr:general substrate transporter [Microdochium trichocladiopsis]KAH7039885.1 general substrate transporter [Microdochium trichocladiopsis]